MHLLSSWALDKWIWEMCIEKVLQVVAILHISSISKKLKICLRVSGTHCTSETFPEVDGSMRALSVFGVLSTPGRLAAAFCSLAGREGASLLLKYRDNTTFLAISNGLENVLSG